MTERGEASQYHNTMISPETHDEMMGRETEQHTSGVVGNGEREISIGSLAIRHGK